MIIYRTSFKDLEAQLSKSLNDKKCSEEILLKTFTEMGVGKAVDNDLFDVFKLYQFVQIKKAYEENTNFQVAIAEDLADSECEDLEQFYKRVRESEEKSQSQNPGVQRRAKESLAGFQEKIDKWYNAHVVSLAKSSAQLKLKRNQLEEKLSEEGFADHNEFHRAFESKKTEYDRLVRINRIQDAERVKADLDKWQSVETLRNEIEQIDTIGISQVHFEAAADERGSSKTRDIIVSVNPIRNNEPTKAQVDISSFEKPQNLIDSAYFNSNIKESNQVTVEIHPAARKKMVVRNIDVFDDAAVKFSYFSSINMPDCAEKSVFLLSLYLRRELQYNKVGYSLLFKKEDAIAFCELLQQQLIDEGIRRSEEAQEATKEILSVLELHHPDKSSDRKLQLAFRKKLEAINKSLDILLKEIRPVDISWLLNLLEQARLAANQISGKHIGLFLGKTGVGKSTTMHFLSGAKMNKVKIDGLSHIAPSIKPNSALENITTSPHSFSVTKSIHPVDIELPASNSRDTSEQITLCDCPGFEDSEGVESDIANSVIITTSIRKALSVKPIVFVSSDSVGARFDGISSLVKTLVKFMPRAEDFFSSFTYVFTKYEKDKAAEIESQLESVITHLPEDQSSTSFSKMLENMRDQVSENLIALDPINDKPETLLKVIQSKEAIEITNETFSDYTSPLSYNSVREQLLKHSSAIESALSREKLDLAAFVNPHLN